MGRGWRRARKLSTAPVPYPTAVFQGTQAKPYGEDLRRHQREYPPPPDLDSPDRPAPAEVAASPLQGRLVVVQSGFDAATEPVCLPRFDQVAPRSDGNAAPGSGLGATYSGSCMIWTGCGNSNRRPPPRSVRNAAVSRLSSARFAIGLSRFGQQ